MFPTYISVLFEKIHINIVKMPKWNEKIYIIVTKKDLSEWVKARTLFINISGAITKFL